MLHSVIYYKLLPPVYTGIKTVYKNTDDFGKKQEIHPTELCGSVSCCKSHKPLFHTEAPLVLTRGQMRFSLLKTCKKKHRKSFEGN